MEIKPWAWKAKCYGTISLCMIMRNEERWLARCLDSVVGLVDEIIIVDTGSTDNSVAIAERYGAIVLHDEWKDDFGKPRNIGIVRATKQWILIMDPDEAIARKDHQRVREMTNMGDIVAYQMDTRNYTQNRYMQGFHPNRGDYEEGKGWPGYCPSLKTRFFKNGLGFHFCGRWHELADYSIDKRKHRVALSPVPIHHYAGEINQKSMKERTEFYLKMGELKVKDNPNDGQAWWELGVAEGISGYPRRAVVSIMRSMKDGFYTADRMFQLVNALKKCGLDKAANLGFEKAICKIYPNLTHCEERFKKLDALIPHFDKK